MTSYNPCVDGLRVGSLIEYTGQLGLIDTYIPEYQAWILQLLDGSRPTVTPDELTVPTGLKRPGQGGDKDSFDLVIGQNSDESIIAENMSSCLEEKGFCVLKLTNSHQDCDEMHEALKASCNEGCFARLPQEVERGYLGDGPGAPAKVMWLDADNEDIPEDKMVKALDLSISRFGKLLMPYAQKALGVKLEDRMPTLVGLSLTDNEEEEYPFPVADDVDLVDSLSIWQRSVLKTVCFMGPATPLVMLQNKGSVDLAVQLSEVAISASRNTFIIYRHDCYSLYYPDRAGQEENVSFSSTYLTPQLEFSFSEEAFGGDDSNFDPELGVTWVGVPPPTGKQISVVNLACRLPGSFDHWEGYDGGLSRGADIAQEFPFVRFNWWQYYEPDENAMMPWQTYCRHITLVEGLYYFDNKYFGVSDKEAYTFSVMNRQILEVGSENLYKMGITRSTAARKPHHAGCSVGLDKDDWDFIEKAPYALGGQNVQAIISNRFSFVFNLKGPNYVADTACSAALCATHLAKGCLKNEFDPLDFWVAMGIHQCLKFDLYIGMAQSRMAPAEGRCLTFNATASGYVRGDGCSAVAMKYGNMGAKDTQAILRAIQMGQNGRSATLTAPNGLAQEDVINKALRESGTMPRESSIWDCHGTGTSLGDPIEVGAIRKVMLKDTRQTALVINTNKANIGHLEGGAAMGSILAVVSECSHCYADPSIHLRQLNPHLEQSQFDAFFNSELGETFNTQVHVHVSSFGFGGTNGHAMFWGRTHSDLPTSAFEAALKKFKRLGKPEIFAMGSDPSEWTCDYPDKVQPGDVYSVDTSGETVKWLKSDADEYMDKTTYTYTVCGNWDEFEGQQMRKGDVPGQYVTTVTIEAGGYVEFYFLENDNPDKIICPAIKNCYSKTAKIIGPQAETKNSWVAEVQEGKELRIDLFVSGPKMSVMWLSR